MLNHLFALFTCLSIFAGPVTPAKQEAESRCFLDTKCSSWLKGAGVDGSHHKCKQAGGKSFRVPTSGSASSTCVPLDIGPADTFTVRSAEVIDGKLIVRGEFVIDRAPESGAAASAPSPKASPSPLRGLRRLKWILPPVILDCTYGDLMDCNKLGALHRRLIQEAAEQAGYDTVNFP